MIIRSDVFYQSLCHHDAVCQISSPSDEEDPPLACDWKPGGPSSSEDYCDKSGEEIKGVPTVEPGRRAHWPDIGGRQREQSVLQSVTR